jgi:tricorn protease-like protein
MTVYPYPTKFISISGDNKRFMFESNQDIYTFTFFNETLNPLEEAGTKIIKDIKEENKPRWIGRSKHISYVKDGSIYISESDGENAIKILPIDNVNFFTVKSSRDNIVTFEKDTEEIFNINEYRL